MPPAPCPSLFLGRLTGLEPVSPGSQPSTLPLSYSLHESSRSVFSISVIQSVDELTQNADLLTHWLLKYWLSWERRIRTSTSWFRVSRPTFRRSLNGSVGQYSVRQWISWWISLRKILTYWPTDYWKTDEAERGGIEPPFPDSKSSVLPLDDLSRRSC